MFAIADAVRLPFSDRSFDLVLGSPPYGPQRTYGIGAGRDTEQWIRWMLRVSEEALRVSRGLVLWVCAGWTRKGCYQPGPEGLLYEWWKRGGECECWRPCYWNRTGVPGSGSKRWYRADIEYVLCLKRPGIPGYCNPTANGHTPKWAPGGEMSHRLTDGTRVNQWGGHATTGRSRRRDGTQQRPGRPSHRKRKPGGSREIQYYTAPAIADPGNYLADSSLVIETNAGGGHMGNPIAHLNEAPFPERLAEFFLASHCPPGGSVLDCFSGSGTTVAVASKLGRLGVGTDLRMSQCELGRRRLGTTTPGFPFA